MSSMGEVSSEGEQQYYDYLRREVKKMRQPPTESECIEALTVMVEAYGKRRVEALLAIAVEDLRKEQEEV